jgi:phospholipase/carboxylesterase
MIEKEINLLEGKENNLILGGFSQGGVMSLHLLFETEFKFGGVLIVSGYLLPLTNVVEKRIKECNTKIFHGDIDKVRPLD